MIAVDALPNMLIIVPLGRMLKADILRQPGGQEGYEHSLLHQCVMF